MNIRRITTHAVSIIILLVAVTIGAALGSAITPDTAAQAAETDTTVPTSCFTMCGNSTFSTGNTDSGFAEGGPAVSGGNVPTR